MTRETSSIANLFFGLLKFTHTNFSFAAQCHSIAYAEMQVRLRQLGKACLVRAGHIGQNKSGQVVLYRSG